MTIDELTSKFCQVYADASVSPEELEDMSAIAYDEWWKEVSAKRELEWKSQDIISLSEAAKLYANMKGNYNSFEHDMLQRLNDAFPDSDIKVRPGREFSVVVYLCIPEPIKTQVVEFVDSNFMADEVEDCSDGFVRIWWD